MNVRDISPTNAVIISTTEHFIIQISFAMSMILKLTSFRTGAKLSLKLIPGT
jgi:hypothetical protein